jgi:hypothetical protein
VILETRGTNDVVDVAERETSCRSCGGEEFETVLDLSTQPLANSIRPPDELDKPEPSFSLTLVLCAVCSLLQILESVNPALLFSEYPTSRP